MVVSNFRGAGQCEKQKNDFFLQTLLTNYKTELYYVTKFEYLKKKTVTRTVGLKILERVAGWCEAMVRLSNDLSPLSRRTESESK